MKKMAKSRSKPKPKNNSNNLFIIAGIAVIVLSILLLKGMSGKSEPDQQETASGAGALASAAQPTPETPDEQFNRLYAQKRPIFVFFHSNNCQLCVEMIDVVASVFPEYEGKIELLDIDVYDEANQNLIQSAQIKAIPTQFFFSGGGDSFSFVGKMSPDQLREALDQIVGEGS